MTTDPYGQHFSPYMAMGNNPISGIDTDGGWDTKLGRWLSWAGSGFQDSRSDFFQNDNGQYGIAFDVANGSGTGDLTGTEMVFGGSGFDNLGFSDFDFQGNMQATIGPAQPNF